MELTEQFKKELEERFAALDLRRLKRAAEEQQDAEEAAAIQVLLRGSKPDPSIKKTLPLFKAEAVGDPSFRDRVREAIASGARRMTIGDVVKALEDHGYKHEGKTPLKTKVGNELYKLSKQGDETIQGNGKGLYWAKNPQSFVQRNAGGRILSH